MNEQKQDRGTNRKGVCERIKTGYIKKQGTREERKE